MPTPVNAQNITSTGLVKFDGTATFSGVTTTQFDVLVGAASNGISSIGPGSAGQVLQSGGAASNPAYSTATFPSTATVTGTILRADGTNWVATTATYPSTTTSQQILYSTANNVVGQLTTANSKFPATNSSGTLAMRALSVNIQTFIAPGTATYTPTSGMVYCIIECVAGGGGGGGTASAGGSTYSAGAGGGGGAYGRKFASATTIGASQTVTVGAGGSAGSSGNNAGGTGGASSVGTICTANGGAGGNGSNGTTFALGGAGGANGTADFGVSGQNGYSTHCTTVVIPQGSGGFSIWGFGAPASELQGGTAVSGGAGQGFGGGGSGGVSFNAAGAQGGGAGAAGAVVITEYVIA